MQAWLNWRMAISSIIMGGVFAALLFAWTGRSFSLSGLDLFFAIATAISLGFNLWQLFRDKYKYSPLKFSLIGLFNDVKGRELRAYNRQNLILSPAGSSLPLEAVRLEFFDYVQESIQSLQQLREHVVAAIYTLDQEGSAQQVFRAADFGLTDQERLFKEEGMERFMENARSVAAEAPQAQRQASSPPPSAERPRPAHDTGSTA